MVGKRKDREEDGSSSAAAPSDEPQVQPVKGSTLFVSNLPYTATSVDLQTLFSDIAPVRSAFVVLDKETRKSKGVGYVSFAIKEDAALAVEQIEKGGILLDKRNLRVQFADSKPHDVEDGSPGPKLKRPRLPRRPQPSTPTDPMAIRTIVISGLPSTIDSHTLWKKVRKFGGAEKVSQWPVKTASGEEDPTTAQVLFSTPTTAQDAVLRLHAHVFKGSLLSVVLKKRLDTLAKSSGNPSRASRLIVRNLPWNATENDLRRLFLPYGPIHSITLPTAKPEEEGGRPRAKGFAFIWMMSKKDAEKAIEGANGATVGQKEGDPNAKGKERVIAVDWALSKERWDQEKEKITEEDAVAEDSESGPPSGSQSESDSEDDHVGVLEGSGDEESDAEENDQSGNDDENAPERPQLPPPETGNTLFIRNLPFTATEDELRTLFRSFGPLRYARITMDPATGRSRGTGFVCFWNKEDADRAIQQAELLNAETGGATVTTAIKKNPFKLSSILTPDPSSSLAQSLVMHGRTLDVTRAVTREEAGRLRELGEKQREKQDKRNLYLMREGVIFPNTPSASTISETELEKRVQAFNTRRALMRSNPSLYVSKTRLSVRQLPTFATERTLKRLALHAVRKFEDEVKNGTREGLNADEMREDGDEATEADREKKPKRKRGERYTAVRQAKIVRIGDRVDPLTGKGRSKGYGFLEMMSHADALKVLRWANNHPGVEGLLREWWKEELKDLVKKDENAGKTKKSEEEQARLRRLKGRIRELEDETDKKAGRTLVLEFSIENIQVVRRRADREEGGRQDLSSRSRDEKKTSTSPAKKRRDAPSSEVVSRPAKKPRVTPIKEVKSGDATAGNKIGDIIGRKRREKRLKGKTR
ncbi:RNA-binding domain-containing protein [Ramaria rubella]|nr:RNA-binding domain-containing protein [Ramaria rubella]